MPSTDKEIFVPEQSGHCRLVQILGLRRHEKGYGADEVTENILVLGLGMFRPSTNIRRSLHNPARVLPRFLLRSIAAETLPVQ